MRGSVIVATFCMTSISVGCGSASGPTASPEPSAAASEAAPTERKLPVAIRGGCGGPPTAATTIDESKRAIGDVGGAHKMAARALADYTPEFPRSSFESGIEIEDEMFGTEKAAGRIAAYRDEGERYTFVEVSLTAESGSSDLQAWAHGVLLAKEPYADKADGLEIYRRILVYLSIWTDAHGRDNIEYAIVMKGCERIERYLRITRAGGQRLDIEVLFGDVTKPKVAAKHLHGFFDAPLSTPPPPERTFAHGHKTML